MPIDFAFLDSGTGGLPYMMYLREKYPESRCVYLADTKNFPYGTKDHDTILNSVDRCVQLLIKNFNPATIVIACNTMSVIALEQMRLRYKVPFVGTVPAIKLAASTTRNKKIGLLATDRTVEDPYTVRLIKDFASDCQVFKRGDAPLIEFIEKRLIGATQAQRLEAVMPAVSFFKANGADTIVLACTHFTNMVTDFEKAAGPDVSIIDSRDGVARRAMTLRQSTNTDEKPTRETDSTDSIGITTGATDKLDSTYLKGDCPLYVTDGDCETEYRKITDNFGIPFAGVLEA